MSLAVLEMVCVLNAGEREYGRGVRMNGFKGKKGCDSMTSPIQRIPEEVVYTAWISRLRTQPKSKRFLQN